MKQSNPYAATSALSLIAITAGTVSAALLIMFVGLFFTMISITSDTQVTASITPGVLSNDVILVANFAGDKDASGIHSSQKVAKGHYMDALLRDEVKNHSTISSGKQAPRASHMARIYAISLTTKHSPTDVRLTQI